jgi:hypothetical protein
VGASLHNFDMELGKQHLDWQIVSATQVPSTVFSAVEHLTLSSYRHNVSSEWRNEAECIHWRQLLGRTLALSGSFLLLGDEETLTELLPELQKLALRPTHLPNSLMPTRKRAAV